jgi:hypothetical protein
MKKVMIAIFLQDLYITDFLKKGCTFKRLLHIKSRISMRV